MTTDIKHRIHAFRNALVLAADTRSHECFEMGRWQELNAFPHGCCGAPVNLFSFLKGRKKTYSGTVRRLQPVYSDIFFASGQCLFK